MSNLQLQEIVDALMMFEACLFDGSSGGSHRLTLTGDTKFVKAAVIFDLDSVQPGYFPLLFPLPFCEWFFFRFSWLVGAGSSITFLRIHTL